MAEGPGQRIERLFYEIDAETRGFEEGMDRAIDKARSFINYISSKPGFALAAFGAALAGVAVHAAEMAADLESSLNKIERIMPGAEHAIGRVRDAVVDLSTVTPRTAKDLAEAAALIAKLGTSGVDDLITKLKLAVDLADASGTDLTQVIEGLDLVTDQFGLTSEKARAQIAQVFETLQQHGVTLEEFFAVMQRGGSTLATLGLSLTDVGKALAIIVDAGVSKREAGTVLLTILDQATQLNNQLPHLTGDLRDLGTEVLRILSPEHVKQVGIAEAFKEISDATDGNAASLRRLGFSYQEANAILRVAKDNTRELGDTSISAADAMKRMEEQAATFRGDTESLAQILKNQFNAVLLDLGVRILPIVNAALRTFIDFWDILAHRPSAAQDAAESAVRGIADSLDKLDPAGRADAVKRLREEVERLVAPGIGGSAGIAALGGRGGGIIADDFLSKLSDARLKTLRDGLAAIAANAKLTSDQMFVLQENLKKVDLELASRDLTPATPAAAPPAGSGSGGSGREPLTQDQIDRQTQLFNQAAGILVNTTTTVTDNLRQQISQLEAAAEAAFTRVGSAIPSTVREALDALKAQITDAEFEEPIAKAFRDIQERVQEGAALEGQARRDATLGAADDLRVLIARQREYTDSLPEETVQHEQARQVLQQMVGLYNQLIRGSQQLGDPQRQTLAVLQAQLDKARAQAQVIQSAAQGALQLAHAFGLVDDNMEQALDSIVQIGANVGPLLDAIKVAQAGGGIGGVISAALPIAGGLASFLSGIIGGDDPARQQEIQALEDNKRALERLTAQLGEFDLSIRGGDFAKVAAALPDIIAAGQRAGGAGPSGAIDTARAVVAGLGAAGISLEDLRDLAQTLGITFAHTIPSIEELQQLLRAMAATQLTQFAQTFTGQLAALNEEFRLFNITDPIQQLEKLRDLFDDPKFGAPALRRALAGLDLSTPEGREQARAAIQALFQQLQAGTLKPAALGGLTPQQFLDALDQVNELLNAAGPNGTGGFNVDRSITEVTGNRLAGLLTSSNVYLAQIALATAATAAALGSPIPAVVPPPLPSGAGAGAGGDQIVVNLTLNITLDGTLGVSDATRLGNTLAQPIIDLFDAQLAQRIALARAATGRVVVAAAQ